MSTYGKYIFYLPLRLNESEKEKDRFIKDIEGIIRRSSEYRNFIKFLRNEALLNYCTVMNKLPEDVIQQLSLEMHHYPYTLYDLVKTVLDTYLGNRNDFSRLSIANEVMDLHYNLMVGIVPVTKTMHELAHSRHIKISIKSVFGNYNKFTEFYQAYIPLEKIQEIQELESMKEDYLLKVNSRSLEINPSLFEEDEDDDNSTDELEDEFSDG